MSGIAGTTVIGDGGQESSGLETAQQDLLLWALAGGLKPADGWFHAAQLTRRELDALARRHQERFAQLRLLEVIGRLIERRHLDVLLKARLVEQLLGSAGPRELTEISRVIEKLPTDQTAGRDTGETESEPEGLALAEAMREAQRLLAELERDPEVRRLLAETAAHGRENELESSR